MKTTLNKSNIFHYAVLDAASTVIDVYSSVQNLKQQKQTLSKKAKENKISIIEISKQQKVTMEKELFSGKKFKKEKATVSLVALKINVIY